MFGGLDWIHSLNSVFCLFLFSSSNLAIDWILIHCDSKHLSWFGRWGNSDCSGRDVGVGPWCLCFTRTCHFFKQDSYSGRFTFPPSPVSVFLLFCLFVCFVLKGGEGGQRVVGVGVGGGGGGGGFYALIMFVCQGTETDFWLFYFRKVWNHVCHIVL